MNIVLTEEARQRLQELVHETQTIRINGELVGGCGMNVEFFIWWDEALPDDLVKRIGNWTFVVDRETIGYISDDQLKVDYRPQQGFRLVTPQQILAYGLQVKQRWTNA